MQKLLIFSLVFLTQTAAASELKHKKMRLTPVDEAIEREKDPSQAFRIADKAMRMGARDVTILALIPSACDYLIPKFTELVTGKLSPMVSDPSNLLKYEYLYYAAPVCTGIIAHNHFKRGNAIVEKFEHDKTISKESIAQIRDDKNWFTKISGLSALVAACNLTYQAGMSLSSGALLDSVPMITGMVGMVMQDTEPASLRSVALLASTALYRFWNGQSNIIVEPALAGIVASNLCIKPRAQLLAALQYMKDNEL